MCLWESQFQNNFNLVWFGRKQVDFWKGGIRGSLNITKYATQDIFWLWLISLIFFYIFSVSRSHKNRDGAEVANHSPSVRVWPPINLQSTCNTTPFSAAGTLCFMCIFPKKRASINTQYVLIFLVPRSGWCWCWIMGCCSCLQLSAPQIIYFLLIGRIHWPDLHEQL